MGQSSSWAEDAALAPQNPAEFPLTQMSFQMPAFQFTCTSLCTAPTCTDTAGPASSRRTTQMTSHSCLAAVSGMVILN